MPIAPPSFISIEEESLNELSCNNSLKITFCIIELTKFRISIKDEYSILSDSGQQILIQFSTSYLCEAGLL